ncbi:hypothetical protein PGTUg99_006526 [Puccinia graminis f. sp. tritici]|uniref:Uncharacterized protein n=1 Tax=Puccinia graminis f. sp. tritici TaxID=56615 RepID=A0A5B0SHI4_PUCGR|nr:hypothetical protein PGTUg99_006526 [Puccinia graminis f. sp. tritici]
MKNYLMSFKSIALFTLLYLNEIQSMALPDLSPNVFPMLTKTEVLGSRIVSMPEEDAQKVLATIPQFNKQVQLLPPIIENYPKNNNFVPLMGTLCTHFKEYLHNIVSKYPTEGGELLALFERMDSFQKLISDWKVGLTMAYISSFSMVERNNKWTAK